MKTILETRIELDLLDNEINTLEFQIDYHNEIARLLNERREVLLTQRMNYNK